MPRFLLPLIVAACTAGKAPVDPIVEQVEEEAAGPPVARIEPVVDAYHGVEVSDPYRWLEDAASGEVQAWSDGQDTFARGVLAQLPGRDALAADLTRLMAAERVTHRSVAFAGERIFALRVAPPKQQPVLVELSGLGGDASARPLLDPETFDADGLVSIDWFVPSPDGSKLAVSLSRGGTESGDLHLIDVETGELLEEPIPRVNGGTAGGVAAWSPDGTQLLYTRYPRDGERAPEDMLFYVQLYRHTLGEDPASDVLDLEAPLPRIAEIDLEAHHATGRFLITVQHGDGGEFAHWLREPDGSHRQLSSFGDRTVMITFSEDGGALYTVSFADAPRGQITRLPVDGTLQDAVVVIPEGQDVVVPSFWASPSVRELGGRLFVEYQTGGPSEARVFDLQGGPVEGPQQPPVGTLGSMVPTPDGRLLFSGGSFVQPWGWSIYDPAEQTTTPTGIDTPLQVDLTGIEVRREVATSSDGTEVPLNILLPEGVQLDGSNPCIVTGYGGYGVNLTPYLALERVPLLSNGVIYVIANLRGGGEFGEPWHEQGMLTHKQNVFDDFHAVLTHLQQRGYTSAQRTGIMGGSNGGLLMGATFTQHPEAAAAVVSSVGIYDMLRVELSPNGAFNVTEFGTVADPEQFEAMYAYSPYHHVSDGTRYPPILFTTGANDPRVDPMQSRKMMARLQAAAAPGSGPLLLRTSHDAGHGSGTPLGEKIALRADQLAFLLHHVGVAYTPLQP